MDTLHDVIGSLATFEASPDGPVASLCQSYAQASAERLIAISSCAPDEKANLTALAADVFSDAGFACWRPELGRTNELVGYGATFAQNGLLQLMVGLSACGWVGEHVAEVFPETSIVVGPSRVQCSGRTVLTSTAESVSLVSGENSMALRRQKGLLLPVDTSLMIAAPVDGLAIAGGYCVDPEVVLYGDLPVAEPEFPRACAAVVEALDLLGQPGARARDWVDRVSREISLLAPQRAGQFSSRSMSIRPGNIVVTSPIDPVILGESLVHECAHQYYGLGSRLGRFEVETGKLFLSAINGRFRPIGRVALALHAVANIYLFLDGVIRTNPTWRDRALERLIELGPTGDSLARTVEENQAAFQPFAQGLIGQIIKTTDRFIADYGLPPAAAERRLVAIDV